jgi:hypothetical protein
MVKRKAAAAAARSQSHVDPMLSFPRKRESTTVYTGNIDQG